MNNGCKFNSVCLGWFDSSGFRLIYTPTLRENDVGLIQMGTVFGIAVPPQPDEFRVVAFCDRSCTNQVRSNEIDDLMII